MRRVTDSRTQNEDNPSQSSLYLRGEERGVTAAVAGNPNSGKSTLINAIAGTRLHVGNWPGVTVERKTAVFEYEGIMINFVDLPGTYSLSPYTQEEIITRDYLIHEKPDVIINVVDATNLERNLYLTVQLMELGIPIVMALNIYDEAENKGYKINTKSMEKMLNIKVVPTISTKKKGLDELLKTVIGIVQVPSRQQPKRLNYGEDIETAAVTLEFQIESQYPSIAKKYPLRWLTLKLMEGDDHIYKEINISGNGVNVKEAITH